MNAEDAGIFFYFREGPRDINKPFQPPQIFSFSNRLAALLIFRLGIAGYVSRRRRSVRRDDAEDTSAIRQAEGHALFRPPHASRRQSRCQPSFCRGEADAAAHDVSFSITPLYAGIDIFAFLLPAIFRPKAHFLRRRRVVASHGRRCDFAATPNFASFAHGF